MDIKQIITDYIMKSILTTRGDMVVRGLTIPERLAAPSAGEYMTSKGLFDTPAWVIPSIADMEMAEGNFTRNTAGNEVISGLGFKPNLLFFMAGDSTKTNMNWSFGIDNQAIGGSLGAKLNGTEMDVQFLSTVYIFRDAGNLIAGEVTVLGADGFTIAFSLTGACSVNVNWFAIG